MKHFTLLSLVAAVTLSGCVVYPVHDNQGRDYRRVERDGRYDHRDRERDRRYYYYQDRRGYWQSDRGGDQSGGTFAP